MPLFSKLKAKLRRKRSLAKGPETLESDANTPHTPTAPFNGDPPSHIDATVILPSEAPPQDRGQDEDTTVVEQDPTAEPLNIGEELSTSFTPIPTDDGHKDLWKLAGDLLNDSEKNKLIVGNENETNGDQSTEPLEDLFVSLKINKILELTDAAAKADKDKVWRTALNTVVDGTMKLKSLIDAGLTFDPTKYGALAWAVVSFGLQVTQNAKEIREFVFTNSGFVVDVIARYAAYEALYSGERSADPSTAYSRFEEAIVAVYKTLLLFVGEMNHYLKEWSVVHAAKAFLPAAERTLQSKKKDILSEDSKFRDRLEILRDQCTSKRFLVLQKKVASLVQPIYHVSERLNHIERFATRMEREKILSWLPNAQMYLTHTEIRNRIGIENSGVWIFGEPAFKRWRTSNVSWGLWLQGDMGTGKSVLISGVINYMEDLYGNTAQGAMAIYYCSGGTNERNTADDVLGSIARQLCETDQGLDLFQKWQTGHSRNHLTHKALVEIICSLIKLNGRATTTIVIDALDELTGDHFQIVTDGLEKMLDEANGILKVFVSSRPDSRATAVLENWLKIEVSPEATLSDINAYIDYHVEKRLRRKKRVNEELKSEIKSFLKENAGGMFRYAEMALRWICEPDTPRLIREAMRELPGDLSSIYEGLFLMIDKDRPQNRQLARRIICWILSGQVQLKSEDFIDSVVPGEQGYAFDTNKEDILSVCHHLVVYNKTSDVFEFGHFSMNEFIKQYKDEYSPIEAHNMCAWICLRILYQVTVQIERPNDGDEVDGMMEEYVHSVWERSQQENLYYLTGPPEVREQRRTSLGVTDYASDASSSSLIDIRRTMSETRSNAEIDATSGDNPPVSRSSTPSFHMGNRSKFSFPRESSPGYQDLDMSEIPRISFYDYAFQFWAFHCRSLTQMKSLSPAWSEPFGLWFSARVTLPWVYTTSSPHQRTIIAEFVSGSIKLRLDRTPLDGDGLEKRTVPDFTEWLFALSCIFGIPYIAQYLVPYWDRLIHARFGVFRTGLHLACFWGHRHIVSILLDIGADIDALDLDSETPLSTAIRHYSHFHLIDLLFARGANLNGPTPEIGGPLHVAVRANAPEVVKSLLEGGANHCARDVLSGRTVLYEAVTQQKHDILDLLLRHDADCWDSGARLGQTFLTDAIAHADLWSLTALLSLRQDPNQGDEYGQTPLLKAAYLVSNRKFVCLLLAAGARLNSIDIYHWTALHCAASKLRVGVMEVLIERGIDVLHKNTAGMTALDVAWSVVCDETIYVNWDTGELEKWDSGMRKYVGPYDRYTERDIYNGEESEFEMPEDELTELQRHEREKDRYNEEAETSTTNREESEPQVRTDSDEAENSQHSQSECESQIPVGGPEDHYDEKLRRFQAIEDLWEDFVFGKYGQRRNRLLKRSLKGRG